MGYDLSDDQCIRLALSFAACFAGFCGRLFEVFQVGTVLRQAKDCYERDFSGMQLVYYPGRRYMSLWATVLQDAFPEASLATGLWLPLVFLR